MPRTRVVRLKVLLLKPEFSVPEVALKSPSLLRSWPLRGSADQNPTFFVKPPASRVPSWVSFVRSGVDADLAFVTERSCAAVLFVEANQRLLAYIFGHGRNLIKPEAYERSFGLRVVLSTVEPRSLRSVDAKTIEELTLHTRRQASRGSGLETFGLNVTQDLVRSVTGVPRHTGFATSVSGSDGLTFSAPVSLGELRSKSEQLLAAYQSNAYRQCFAFIDHMRRLDDPARVEALTGSLIERIRAGNLDGFHLAPPEPLDWEDVAGFTYSNTRRDLHYDLDLRDYLGTIRNRSELSVETLKRAKVGLKYYSTESSIDKWSLYDCITFEKAQGGALCILSGGDWFEMSSDFARRVDAQVSGLADASLLFPVPLPSESEAEYNRRVATQEGYVLMDRNLLAIGGTAIEVCDLYTPSLQFIHVKRRSASSTLSHLFSQGVVSAESFVSDPDFRRHIREVPGMTVDLALTVPEARPETDRYTIVYLILGARAANWPLSLPFFTRLNLKNAADRLARLGYRVSLARAG